MYQRPLGPLALKNLREACIALGCAGTVAVAVVLRVAELAVVHVPDAGCLELLGEAGLRQAWLPRDWGESDVDEGGHVRIDQALDKVISVTAFVANRDQGGNFGHGTSVTGSRCSVLITCCVSEPTTLSVWTSTVWAYDIGAHTTPLA